MIIGFYSLDIKGLIKGWEFDHRFFDQIDRFLVLKDQFDRDPGDLFKISTILNISQSIFYKDQWDRFDHGRSF